MSVPSERIRAVNDRPVHPGGRYVLYWMIAARRPWWNFALDHAAAEARRLGCGLLVLEALRCDYPWASDRLHRFVLDGMHDNQAALGPWYYGYVEPQPGAGRGLLETLAGDACLVVTDDYPAFFLPRMVEAAAARLPVRLVAVDGNGLLPMRVCDKPMTSAVQFRRVLQRALPQHLRFFPHPHPPTGLPAPALAAEVEARWPRRVDLDPATLPIDHRVAPAPVDGGPVAGRQTLQGFIRHALSRYAEDRNHPDRDAESHLSPYLHFGHVSPHQILQAILDHEGVETAGGHAVRSGSRSGWWGLSPGCEAFLDQLVTWRELGFNHCLHVPRYADYDCLPAWARRTLEAHAGDLRRVYDDQTLEQGRTSDPVWNAAQTQLRLEGRLHNYLRMLWGKKILEWSREPRQALARMIEWNNRYALDGRDPNSYTGILWTLGLYDRPWAPERSVFGSVRYMSSASTVRKLEMEAWLDRYTGLGKPDSAVQETLF